VALLGPNGAGKTTTVEVVEGFRRADGGQVRVGGLDPFAERAAVTRRLGVVLQRGGVYPMMSAERALRLFAAYYDNPRPPSELLDLLGLRSVAGTPYKRLSGGEQQRLALALALVGRPDIACLDEPTAGVDPAGRIAVRDVISELRAGGVCILLTSHELDEVERLADRIVIIDHGRLVAAGRPVEIGGGAESIRFSSAAGLDVTGLAREMGGVITEGPPGRYTVELVPSPARIATLTGWLAERDVALEALDAGRERLEDVFLRLVTRSAEGEQ
jgi:ABC-2 type transport system ATP-binding protein